MAKRLRCRDVGMDCDFVAQAETEEEILQHAAAHARTVHHMQEIAAEVMTAVRAAIRETQSHNCACRRCVHDFYFSQCLASWRVVAVQDGS
jgi:predicted small metal-binding protein